MISIFGENLLIADVKSAFGIVAENSEVVSWLNRMAGILFRLGFGNYFNLTDLTEEVALIDSIFVSQPIVEFISIGIKNQPGVLSQINIGDYQFAKYSKFADFRQFSNVDSDYFDLNNGRFLDVSTKYNVQRIAIVEYKTGYDLTNLAIKKDFMDILGMLYSELGLFWRPNWAGDGKMITTEERVDDTFTKYQDLSLTKSNQSLENQFAFIKTMFSKYLPKDKNVF